MAAIAENLQRVRERIAAAARRSGRALEQVRLVAVSKNQPPPAVQQAYLAGQRDFGENRVQEALAKMEAVAALNLPPPGPTWHLIGHLQGNKARLVPGRFAVVHAVDSSKLAEALNQHAASIPLKVLLQVNLLAESTKSGVRSADDARRLLQAVLACPALVPEGLMTIPDPALDERQTRAHFAAVRGLLEALAREFSPGPRFRELSMGMSQDFEWAVEEGATIVRVGTAVFGERTQQGAA